MFGVLLRLVLVGCIERGKGAPLFLGKGSGEDNLGMNSSHWQSAAKERKNAGLAEA